MGVILRCCANNVVTYVTNSYSSLNCFLDWPLPEIEIDCRVARTSVDRILMLSATS